MTLRIGIDSGGTFTDLVALDAETGQWFTSKVSSTPEQPIHGVLGAIASAGIDFGQIGFLTLGTTVGTNALIQRRGAKVAFLTTEGFEDVPFIQRGNRKFHYDLHWIKPRPFLARHHCLGIRERVDYCGTVVVPLETSQLGALEEEIQKLIDSEGLESIAVSLLFAYRNPAHEEMLGAWLANRFPKLSVSLSHRVAPVWREYERGLTTIADAYLKPLLNGFIEDLDVGLRARGFRGSWALMKSNGGMRLVHDAAQSPIQLLLSGLAGGVIGGKHFALPTTSDMITLDMGGTSCDIAVIRNGEQRYADKFDVEFGLSLTFPTVEVTTIGAGGGSIAWVDRGDFLRVGPQSAGAQPGPACYGRGSQDATVTDANLALGRLDPESLLAGEVKLDVQRARIALQAVANRLEMSLEDTGIAILEIADENMANAVRLATVEIGIDPRGFALVAFGGAGGLHASSIARKLGIRRVLIPPQPGLCSALGTLIADRRSDQMLTASLRSDRVAAAEINVHLERLGAAARAELAAEQFVGTPVVTSELAMRYLGQNYEHKIEISGNRLTDESLVAVFQRFETLHDDFYGYHLAGEVIEIVTIGVTAVGSTRLSLPPFAISGRSANRKRTRSVYFRDSGFVDTPIVQRDSLLFGGMLDGPAIIEETNSTILVSPNDRLTVCENGVLSIEVKNG
jgi:N-methylhydantoinase A